MIAAISDFSKPALVLMVLGVRLLWELLSPFFTFPAGRARLPRSALLEVRPDVDLPEDLAI